MVYIEGGYLETLVFFGSSFERPELDAPAR